MRSTFSGWPGMQSGGVIALGLGALTVVPASAAEAPAFLTYETLNYATADTFLTGIRGSNVVGNYVIPGTTGTGGLYYDLNTGVWSPFPEPTANGANFPGAIGSSPYGPSFGTPSGILRAVGSYQTEASAPYDLSYLYDGAAAPGGSLVTLVYPDDETLYTIAHSTFGNQVVGNYDTRLATGNAFIYDIAAGTYRTNNIPGAVSTTAYGVYGDKIAGGYATISRETGLSFEHGYIYDQATGTYTTYDHPGAVATHFEGITGAGRAGAYNLVTNWITANGDTHPAVLHVAADGTTTWYEIDIPGEVVSSNSAYGDNVIGIYVSAGAINGYVATIPGMYRPIRNETPLVVSADGAIGIATDPGGDDVVNDSSVLVSGRDSVGIEGERFGVITNNWLVTATGAGSTAVKMHGLYGTLLNYGTIAAGPDASAVSTGVDASGTIVVNSGIIDGRVLVAAGPDGRFENSGWLGNSTPGGTAVGQISGVFVQTSAGTLGLRMGEAANDMLEVTGAARLDGALDLRFETENLLRNYTLLTASGDLTGTFASLETSGLPDLFATSLAYSPSTVSLEIESGIALIPGITANQKSVGSAVDGIINDAAGNALGELPEALSPLYALDASQLPAAMSALSGEAYASQRSVLIGDSIYGRQAILGRVRQGIYAGQAGPVGTLAQGGPTISATPDAAGTGTVWGQAFGAWTELDGVAAAVSESIGGIITGGDALIGNWLVGAAIGYSQSDADVDDLASALSTDSLLVALYAGTDAGPWNLRLGASYAFNQIDSRRTIAYPGYTDQASAEYDGGTAQAFAEVGYGIAVRDFAVEPFAGLAWVNLDTDGFTESGAAAGLIASSGSSSVGYSTLGVRAATAMALSGDMALEPYVSVAWQYAFGDVTPSARMAFASAPGASFTVGGMPLAENVALVDVGADLLLSPTARLGLSYMGQFGDDARSNSLQANLSLRF